MQIKIISTLGYGVNAPQTYTYPIRRWTETWSDGRRPLYRRDTQESPPRLHYTRLVQESESKSDPLVTISETLGALNTVGSYIVNITRGMENSENPPKELPSAIYTISKNILGRNMTDSIAPLVRGVTLPLRTSTESPIGNQQNGENIINRDKESATTTCTTAEGGHGKCQDLSNCPQLLLNLTKLRQSLCFKSLFVPGVCCPMDKIESPPSLRYICNYNKSYNCN